MSKSESIVVALFLGLFCGGCTPMQQIGGAYFPGWLLSAGCGLLAVSMVRGLLILAGLDRVLEPRPLAYPAMAVIFTLLTYLIFFP